MTEKVIIMIINIIFFSLFIFLGGFLIHTFILNESIKVIVGAIYGGCLGYSEIKCMGWLIDEGYL